MKISVSVGSVSGESVIHFQTKDVRHASEFLAEEDHEGSSVSLTLETEIPDEAYDLLDYLKARKS